MTRTAALREPILQVLMAQPNSKMSSHDISTIIAKRFGQEAPYNDVSSTISTMLLNTPMTAFGEEALWLYVHREGKQGDVRYWFSHRDRRMTVASRISHRGAHKKIVVVEPIIASSNNRDYETPIVSALVSPLDASSPIVEVAHTIGKCFEAIAFFADGTALLRDEDGMPWAATRVESGRSLLS